MSEQLILKIIDDIEDNLDVLSDLFTNLKMISIDKISEVVNKFINRIKSKLNELENIRKICEQDLPILRGDKVRYKKLYTQLIFSLNKHRGEIYHLSEAYELLYFCEKICKGNTKNSQALVMVSEYVNNIAKELSISGLTPTIVHNDYANLPIEVLGDVYIIMLPTIDLLKPKKWILLAHEVGHILYDIHRDRILTDLMPKIEELLRKYLPEEKGKEDKIREYRDLWREEWLKELVADVAGAALGGPAYLKMLILQLANPGPTSFVTDHPPLEAREIVQLEYLKNVKAQKDLIDTMENVWNEFRSNIIDEYPELPSYLNQKILSEVAEYMTNIIPKPFIVSNWDRILELSSQLPKVNEKDLKLLISAIALSDTDMDITEVDL